MRCVPWSLGPLLLLILLASVYEMCVLAGHEKTPVMATTSRSDAFRGFTPSLFIVVAHRGGDRHP